MTIEERLAHLLEHGIGCPQAVKLGGEAAVAAWCEQQEVTLEARLADAEAQEAADAGAAAVDPAPFVPPVANFYMTDPISRASETMAECVLAFGAAAEKTGTDG